MRLRKPDSKSEPSKRRKKTDPNSAQQSYTAVSPAKPEKKPKTGLRANEEPYSFLLESSGVGTWDWDLRANTLTWSDRCLDMFGIPRGTSMTYERFIEAVHPDDRDRVDAAVKRSLSEKTEYSQEMRSVWPDGSVHWITSRARPYLDDSGEPVRLGGAALDVTRMKRAEEEVNEARAEARAYAENLAAVLDAVPALTFFTGDRECRAMSASRQAREVFGLQPGMNVSMSAPEGRQLGFKWLEDGRELAPEELPVQQAAATGREVRDKKLEVRMPNGNTINVFGHAVPLLDASGAVRGAVGALLDITALQKIEEELKRAQAQAKAHADDLAAILDSIPAVTLIASDPECKHVRTNRFGYDIGGLPYGTNIAAHVPSEQRGNVKLLREGKELAPDEAPLEEAARTGREVRDRELYLQMPDGRVAELFGHAVPLFDDQGKVRGAVGAFLDVTALKKTEAELSRTKAEARAQADNLRAVFDAMPAAAFFSSDRTGKEMISNRMAHELLRVPLGQSTSLSAPEGLRPTHKVFDRGRELREDELPVQRSARTGQPVRDKELEVRFEDGSSVFLFGHAVPLFDERGEVRGAVGAFLDVSDRKVMEERLRLSNERFRLALRNTPITVFNQGLDLRYKWIYNPAEGYRAVDIIGKRDTEILESMEDALRMEAIKSEVLRTGTVFQGEVEIHQQGKPRIYHVTIEPQRDNENRICGLTAASFELTEQKKKEADLAKFARDRQLALDAAHMGWWYYDIARNRTDCDQTFRNLFGFTTETPSGEELGERLHPDDREPTIQKFQRAIDPINPEPYFNQFRILLADGSMRWAESHAVQEFAGEGSSRTVLGLSGTVRDITERKQAEEALRVQRERYDFVAESSDVGFWFCDLPFDRLIWDNRVKGHFGLAPEDEPITVERFYQLLHPDDREPTRQAIETSIQNNAQYDVEYRTMGPDGAQRWVRATGRPSYDAAGKPVRFDGITQDITGRKLTQEALRESEARYRELAANLDLQVQQRTRELQRRTEQVLRTSDAVRMLNTRLLQSQEQERRRIARELHDSSGQILTAIGLDLASIAQKVQEPQIREIAPDLLRQVEETETLVQKLHRELRTTSYLLHPPLLEEAGLQSAVGWYVQGVTQRSGLEIDVDIPNDFGRLSRDLELTFFRVIQESLTNIIRHSGSKRAAIRFSRGEREVSLEIRDEGKGMPGDKLAEVQSGVTGFGIRAMRERLHPFHGELGLESGEGGTRVVITIPAEHSGARVESGIEPAPAAR